MYHRLEHINQDIQIQSRASKMFLAPEWLRLLSVLKWLPSCCGSDPCVIVANILDFFVCCMFCSALYFHSTFANERAGCFTLFVFLVCYD